MGGVVFADAAVAWAAVSAIGQIVAAVLAGLAFYLSLRTYWKTLHIAHYSELDRQYADLLRLAVERPKLRAPDELRTEDERAQYHAYAHIVWNFIETVHDRGKDDPMLIETWKSAMLSESRFHRAWFDRKANEFLYKEPFREWVRNVLDEK
jgi:hypothetical protein